MLLTLVLFLSCCCFLFQRSGELVSLPSQNAIWAFKVHSLSQPRGPSLTQPAPPHTPHPFVPLVSHSRSKVLVLPCGTCWEWRASSCASVAVTFLLYLQQNPIGVDCPPVLPTVRRPSSTLWIHVVILPLKLWSSFMWISEALSKWHVNQNQTIYSQAKVTIMPFLDEWVCLLWPMCTLWCFNQPLKWYPRSLYSLLFRPFWWRGGMQQCLQWKKVAQRLGALKNKSASISLYCIFCFWYANCPPQPSLKTFHQFFFFFFV